LNKKTERRRAAVLTSTAALAFALAVAFWFAPGLRQPGHSAPVERAEEWVVVANGRVEPISEEISVGTQVLGTLAKVLVKGGDTVSAGQIIAETENADLAATVEKADATVNERRAKLEKLLRGARSEERLRIAAEFNDATALLSLAEGDVRRERPLAERHFVAAADFDHKEWTLASLRARQQVAHENLKLINAPPRTEDVDIAQANLDVATADAAAARAVLEKTRIRAPIDGTVLRLLRRAGEPVGIYPPTIVAKIGDIRTLRVIAEVEESDIARVRPGQPVYVTADAFKGQHFHGTVSRLADTMGRKELYSDDPSQHLDAKALEVTVTLDKDVRLPVGLRVDVFIQDQQPQS
jgi:HlyD family secretion protein